MDNLIQEKIEKEAEEVETTSEKNNEKTLKVISGGRGKITPRWKKGRSGNPGGRPKGRRDFKTDFFLAARQIAEKLRLGKEPDAVQIALLERGIKEGLMGNFPFYKDLIERLYGKVEDKVQVDDNIKFVQVKIIKKDENSVE